MTVEKVGEEFRCSVCGNEVKVIKVGGGTLVCCGKDMERFDIMEEIRKTAKLPEYDVG